MGWPALRYGYCLGVGGVDLGLQRGAGVVGLGGASSGHGFGPAPIVRIAGSYFSANPTHGSGLASFAWQR